MEQLIQGILKSYQDPALLVDIVRWRLIGCLVIWNIYLFPYGNFFLYQNYWLNNTCHTVCS